ncbi:MAG: helix-turn-helix domain-containing protein [Eggerthellaceae bacterium]|nr:helix-turn-helix domain-containing protein [Eggerthellaceae bacterium]
MNNRVTGSAIKRLRTKSGMTQRQLGEQIGVGDKAISRWECGRGFPEITLLEPLSFALGVSVSELISGSNASNENKSANMLKSRFYVCPKCGNILFAAGEASVSCCGINLVFEKAQSATDEYGISIEYSDGELYVSTNHPMTKACHVSFMAAVSADRVQLVRLYPEGDASARFRREGVRDIYVYCKCHGLFRTSALKAKK